MVQVPPNNSFLTETTLFRSLYIHIPYCESICHYCDFYKKLTDLKELELFVLSCQAELQYYDRYLAKSLNTVFLGGGTPSILNRENLSKIFSFLDNRITTDTEITIEANPADVTNEKVALWNDIGINRISIGVQSLNDKTLSRLSRRHSARQALGSVDLALKKFDNISCDLIYGVPVQKNDEAVNSFLQLNKMGISHLSAYSLTLKSGNSLFKELPSDDLVAAQYDMLVATIKEKNWHQYEISNFQREDLPSIHNSGYWNGQAYLGIGPSAHSYDGFNQRWANLRSTSGYVSRLREGKLPLQAYEKLSDLERLTEKAFTRLRTAHGLYLPEIKEEFGLHWAHTKASLIDQMQAQDLCSLEENWLRLSAKGMYLCDEVVTRLIEN